MLRGDCNEMSRRYASTITKIRTRGGSERAHFGTGGFDFCGSERASVFFFTKRREIHYFSGVHPVRKRKRPPMTNRNTGSTTMTSYSPVFGVYYLTTNSPNLTRPNFDLTQLYDVNRAGQSH